MSARLGIIIPSVLAVVTVVNSINIRSSNSHDVLKQASIINGFIFALQIIILATDGFVYQYTQGNNIALLLNTKNFRWGTFFDPMALSYELSFDSSDTTVIGVNFLALVLAIASFWAAGNLRSDIEE